MEIGERFFEKMPDGSALMWRDYEFGKVFQNLNKEQLVEKFQEFYYEMMDKWDLPRSNAYQAAEQYCKKHIHSSHHRFLESEVGNGE